MTLAGKQVVDMVISDFCILARPARGQPFKLVELAPGVAIDQLRSKTEGALEGWGR